MTLPAGLQRCLTLNMGLSLVVLALTARVTGQPHRAAATPAALAVWRRSLSVGADVPMRADMLLTYRRHGIVHTVRAKIVQGAKGACKITFVSPAEMKGKVLCSDGRSAWQIEPRAASAEEVGLAAASTLRDRRVQSLIENNYRIRFASADPIVSGRACQVIDLLPIHAGKSRQRRWVDTATGKTLRIETTYTDNIRARLLTFSPSALPAAISASDFAPILAQTGQREIPQGKSNDAAQPPAEAALAHMPANAPLGFRLIEWHESAVDGRKAVQLLYTDGIETVSVFVQKKPDAEPVPSGGWSRIVLNGFSAYQNTDHHVYAVSWVNGACQCTAISHLTPTAMRQFVTELHNEHR